MRAPLRVPKDDSFDYLKVTAYCACAKCCGKWSAYRRTAWGMRPTAMYTVAADTSIYPFGSVLSLPGLGSVMVQDTGSAVRGYHVDVYHGHGPGAHERAVQFGMKFMAAKVIHLAPSKGAR